VEKELGSFLKQMRVPGKRDCDRCLANSGDALAQRGWKDIKNYIYNSITRAQKNVTKLPS